MLLNVVRKRGFYFSQLYAPLSTSMCLCVVWRVLPVRLSPDDLMLFQPEALVWPPSDFLLTSSPLPPSCLFLLSHLLLPKISLSLSLCASRRISSPKPHLLQSAPFIHPLFPLSVCSFSATGSCFQQEMM